LSSHAQWQVYMAVLKNCWYMASSYVNFDFWPFTHLWFKAFVLRDCSRLFNKIKFPFQSHTSCCSKGRSQLHHQKVPTDTITLHFIVNMFIVKWIGMGSFQWLQMIWIFIVYQIQEGQFSITQKS
jgi:hypothetical protein